MVGRDRGGFAAAGVPAGDRAWPAAQMTQ